MAEKSREAPIFELLSTAEFEPGLQHQKAVQKAWCDVHQIRVIVGHSRPGNFSADVQGVCSTEPMILYPTMEAVFDDTYKC